MKIAVSTVPGSPDDLSVWSGTPANFVKGLRRAADEGDEVIAVGPLNQAGYFLWNKLSGVTGLGGRKINWEVERHALRMFTRALDRELDRIKPDVAIVMGWIPLKSRSNVPLVFWGDATIGQRIDLAPHWSKLSRRTRRAIPAVEKECLSEFEATFWATDWAANDANERYGVSNTHRVPFASNIDDPQVAVKLGGDIDKVNLLAVGVKWHRKGIDRAVHAADELISRGTEVHLDVVGVQPPDKSWNRSYVTYHGFLNKAHEPDRLALDNLYRRADIFILPTRNEPFGIVFQEAAAYGLPVVASDVGGVSEVVNHDETGILLSEGAWPRLYADAIAGLVRDNEKYTSMSSAARSRYESDFTWDGCGNRVLRLLRDTLLETRTTRTS
jgi:glycosyltransferase involved in cell wall biosynthesis